MLTRCLLKKARLFKTLTDWMRLEQLESLVVSLMGASKKDNFTIQRKNHKFTQVLNSTKITNQAALHIFMKNFFY
jgi:hypothetical protein